MRYLSLFLFFFISLNISAQQEFSNFSTPKKININKGAPTALSFSYDPGLVREVFSDTLATPNASYILNGLKPEPNFSSRSIQDAALFKRISPSVVLIVTKDGIGSGTIIGSQGQILTNYHVVGNNLEVGAILKPSGDTQKVSKADITRAKVIKVDQVTDLALIQLVQIPVGRAAVRLGDDSEINIGMDVHAIGHPRGDNWTYTKGVISQYRNDYEWLGHKADVIQTQTPINPGNSGGPLLSDKGNLLGVNSFVDTSAQGINFAVSVEDVKKFLKSNGSRYLKEPPKAASNRKCEMKEVYKGRTDDGKAETIVWDSNCTGKADMGVIIPNDKTKAIYMEMDRNGDEKVDVILFSPKRDYKWEFSFWDNNFDGKWELVGFHKNGDSTPYKFEDYSKVMSEVAKN